MSDFRGARGSNTGDDFHELWAARHAIRLLDDRDPLQAMTVEGIALIDQSGASEETWDGVDCALYEGGRDALEASHITLEQLKYSAANPSSSWTVSRITQGATRDDSVLHRLAKAWAGINARGPKGSVDISLVTNQPIAAALEAVTSKAAAGGVSVPRQRPNKDAPDEEKFAYASGLSKAKLPAFSAALRLNGGVGSRYAIEAQLLADMAGWADLELQTAVAQLRQFIRHRMRPEFADELITREVVLLGLGVSSMGSLFPCPSVLKNIASPVHRGSVDEVASSILAGRQRICMHGPGGIGKSTALQQIEAALPPHSIMVTFDCYGGGTYLDASALRHRPADAFLQLTNELATKLRLPILLGRHQQADPVRLFWNRLEHASRAHAAEHPQALIVIAIDAADNAITAAQLRRPPESCFVHDFAALGDPPANVRFVITARTGRLEEVGLPLSYLLSEIQPFTRGESEANVRRTWNAPASWVDEFHQLTRGVPRVQAYAMDLGGDAPENAIDRLLPGGRSLDQVFREQFKHALGKGGRHADVARFCAGLITLARPVPLADLSEVLGVAESALIDICSDMAPAIRLNDSKVSFADEDFEHFVREEAKATLADITARAADWLLVRCKVDSYAAQHVAAALAAAGRGTELLDLVESEPSPLVVKDPVERREAELSRIRLAISFCRNANDVARAMRFVLIGAEGLKTERALREMLSENPDLAVRFAPVTAARLILTDPGQIGFHGAFLLHRQVINATRCDRASLREDGRLIRAWMALRSEHMVRANHSDWRLVTADVAASVETKLREHGPDKALLSLWSWSPKKIRYLVARSLVPRLLSQGDGHLLQGVLDTGRLRHWEELLLLAPMALSGLSVDPARMAAALATLLRRRLSIGRLLADAHSIHEIPSWMMDMAMTACEVLATDRSSRPVVDEFLELILAPENLQIATVSTGATASLDLLFRAHALRVARIGVLPRSANLYVPRPKPTDEKAERNRHGAYDENERDRKLTELTDLIFPVYAWVAAAAVGLASLEDTKEALGKAAKSREDNSWRFSRDFDASALAMAAARGVLQLTRCGLDAASVAALAGRIHGKWGGADTAPEMQFAERMALDPALHASLVSGIDNAVSQIRELRVGADDKVRTLLGYARLLLPISPEDANAIFNDSVDVAAELDREVVTQLRLLAEMLQRGHYSVASRRIVAHDLSEALADASIRLGASVELPLDQVMAVLAKLDLPLALANSARWDDSNLVGFRDSLSPALETGIATGELAPGVAMALDLLSGDQSVIEASLDRLDGAMESAALAEEAAWDVLIRHGRQDSAEVVTRIRALGSQGTWGRALAEQHEFVSLMSGPLTDPANDYKVKRAEPPVSLRRTWTKEVLLDTKAFEQELRAALEDSRASKLYVSASEVIDGAADHVSIRDRIGFLKVLSGVRADGGREIVEKLLELLERWNSPAVRAWAASELPDLIVTRLPDFLWHTFTGTTSLPRALKWAALASGPTVDVLLRGVELHGEAVGGEQVFALAALIAGHIEPKDAAATGAWYAHRLAERIKPEDKDQPELSLDLPQSAPVAVARLLYSCLGDYDVRTRWRAAHAVRRLARVGADTELRALIAEYGRRAEGVFRSPQHEFYWIASRLWFAIAWDRIACELPQVGSLAGKQLLAIALDSSFPHLLVISFARDACLKLAAAGSLVLDSSELQRLMEVGRSPLAPEPADDERPRGRQRQLDDSERRFHFDPMDTIPYWYDPMVRSFAKISQDQLLSVAETWIIDHWEYPGEIRSYEAERRRGRFTERDWSKTSNRHGSNPTLERLSTHLEWHGLWCAVGELLKKEPLAAGEESDWDSLQRRLADQMLTQPPLWSSDLLGPVPLRRDFWRIPQETLGDWVLQVSEGRLRTELTPADRPGYVAVGGTWHIRASDRTETLSLSSALVGPEYAGALVRALQTMGSAWDYSIPRESEEDFHESASEEYRMIPWLRCPSSDGGVDHLDPFRGNASLVDWMPGQLVSNSCGLIRDNIGRRAWSASGRSPMFVYEVWGDDYGDDDQYYAGLAVSGSRLLVDSAQLREFLQHQELELLIEVEVSREGRSNQRGIDPEGKVPEATYDRVYRLDADGGLHAAEGCVGAWTGYSP